MNYKESCALSFTLFLSCDTACGLKVTFFIKNIWIVCWLMVFSRSGKEQELEYLTGVNGINAQFLYTLHRQRAFNFVGPDAVLGRCFFGCCDVRERRDGDGPGTSGDD